MQRCPNARSGFTLIELLVVIAIIIILIGLLFPAFRGVQDQAKRAQAKNDLTQIVTAVNAFYTEYGRYPTTASADIIYGPAGSTTNDALFNELRAVSSTLNTRQIVFISPPTVKNATQPRAGIATQTVTVNGISIPIGSFVDPWGTPYNVEIDGDYTNQIEINPYPDTDGSAGATPLRLGVISWSYGSDQTKGTKTPTSSNFKNSDDVISWQ
jgi:prepilin-type N-terminal cleavage/methylation domain-containing protein